MFELFAPGVASPAPDTGLARDADRAVGGQRRNFQRLLVVHDLSRAGKGAVTLATALAPPGGHLDTHVHLHPRELCAYDELSRRRSGHDELLDRLQRSVSRIADRGGTYGAGSGAQAGRRTNQVWIDSSGGDPVDGVLHRAHAASSSVVVVPARALLPRAWHRLAPSAYQLARRLDRPTWLHRRELRAEDANPSVVAVLPSDASRDFDAGRGVVAWGIRTAQALGGELVLVWVDWPDRVGAGTGDEALQRAMAAASTQPIPLRAVRVDASPKAGLLDLARAHDTAVLLLDRADGAKPPRGLFGRFPSRAPSGLGDRALFAAKRARCDVFLVD